MVQTFAMSRTQPHPTSHLLTKAEAAAYLGIAPRTLDDWRAARAIPCVERPGYVRFLRSDLDGFIDRHRIAARTARAYRPRRVKVADSSDTAVTAAPSKS